MSMLAPIVVFVYNRPEHTRKTLEALSANFLASQSELFVFADGARANATSNDLAKLEETRKVIREKDWCGKVTIIERTDNAGLAASITSGVSRIVNEFGKVIVLEDDIVTAPSFLAYMNNALQVYENDEKVMHIAGFTFPWVEASKIEQETFFYRVPSCWGWATWARAWKHYNDDSKDLFIKLCETNRLSYFDFEYSGGFLGQLNANIVKSVRTWAVKWYASTLLQNGIALHPSVSLVNNIGFDSTGENSNATRLFDHKSLGNLDHVERQELKENKYVAQRMTSAYRNTFGNRLRSFLANRVKNFVRLKYFAKG